LSFLLQNLQIQKTYAIFVLSIVQKELKIQKCRVMKLAAMPSYLGGEDTEIKLMQEVFLLINIHKKNSCFYLISSWRFDSFPYSKQSMCLFYVLFIG